MLSKSKFVGFQLANLISDIPGWFLQFQDKGSKQISKTNPYETCKTNILIGLTNVCKNVVSTHCTDNILGIFINRLREG